MDKLQTTIAITTNVGFVIGQCIIPAARVLREHTNQDTAHADDPESATRSLDVEYIPSVAMQNGTLSQSVVWWQNAGQPEADPNQMQNAEPGRRKKSVASPLTQTSISDDEKRDVLPFGCTSNFSLKDRFLLN